MRKTKPNILRDLQGIYTSTLCLTIRKERINELNSLMLRKCCVIKYKMVLCLIKHKIVNIIFRLWRHFIIFLYIYKHQLNCKVHLFFDENQKVLEI